ncbi:MAG TPA: hypothetical protein VEA16_04845 [Vicinamibacterales bacterium]|nr:hypothetical protein [Vicinamibacterales bacterium]
MSSQELSAWWALWAVHTEEAKRLQDMAEAGDGQVIEWGRDDDGDEDHDGDE